MQKQNGSLTTFLAVAIVSVAIGLIWVHLSDKTLGSPSTVHTSTNKQASRDQCTTNAAGKTVIVSISNQQLWACDGTDVVKQSAITTGASNAANGVNNSTPVGTWRIYEKYQSLYLKGSDANGPWNDYVQYWMPFDSAIGFHDASWQTFPFGSSQYKTDGSHGCVQLPTNVAAWLYGWAPIGTKVIVSA